MLRKDGFIPLTRSYEGDYPVWMLFDQSQTWMILQFCRSRAHATVFGFRGLHQQLSRCAFPVVRLCSYWNRCLYIRMSERVGAMLQADRTIFEILLSISKKRSNTCRPGKFRSNRLKQIWKTPEARSGNLFRSILQLWPFTSYNWL